MIIHRRGDPHPYNLEPCPLCGAPARATLLETGCATLNATIECSHCGLTLEWETQFATYRTPEGGLVVTKISLDPFEAWNRRAKI